MVDFEKKLAEKRALEARVSDLKLAETAAAEPITLTEGQQDALNQLKSWWDSKEKNIVLSGAPGTGKTFTAKLFANTMKRSVPLFTAPTNEAVRQLELSLKGSSPTRTTYAALGLTLSRTSYNQKIYQKSLPKDFFDYNMLVVDEGSMAGKQDPKDKDSHKLLMDYVLETGMRTVWLADWAQLPPVESKDGTSPLFNQGFKTLELTQVKRHSGPILEYALMLRDVLTKPVKNMPKFIDGINLVDRNSSGLITFSDEDFEKIITDQARVITWTNEIKVCKLPGVKEYNANIRARLFGETLAKASDIYPTDRLLFASPLIKYKTVYETVEFSEKLVKIENESLASVNSRAEVMHVSLATVMGVECHKAELELEGGQNATAYIPTHAGKLEKAKKDKFLREQALKAGGGMEAGKGWMLYHTFQEFFADVKHTYCITGHRSQGSTIPEVFVDIGNILQNRDRLVAFKNLYVASTRARDKLTYIRN